MAEIVTARCVYHDRDLELRRPGGRPKGRPAAELPYRCPEAEGVPGGKLVRCEWSITYEFDGSAL
jgi:hypothetical protein